MIRDIFKEANPFVKIIFSLFIMVISFIGLFIIGILIALPFLPISLAEIPTIYTNLDIERNVIILKYIQALNTTGLFIIPAFIIAFLVGEKAKNYLHLKYAVKIKTIFLVMLIMFISLPLINYLAMLNEKIIFPDFLSGLENRMKLAEENAQYLTGIFVNVKTFHAFLFNMLVIAILPALGEELIFRGVFQKILINWTGSIHWGIFISAILFSAFHMQFYGFIPRMLLGVLFGYLLIWSNSLWIPIWAHFVNNAMAVTFYYLYNIGLVNYDFDNLGAEGNNYYILFFSGMSLALLIILIKRIEMKNSRKIII